MGRSDSSMTRRNVLGVRAVYGHGTIKASMIRNNPPYISLSNYSTDSHQSLLSFHTGSLLSAKLASPSFMFSAPFICPYSPLPTISVL